MVRCLDVCDSFDNFRNALTSSDKKKWLKPGSRVLLGRTRTVAEPGDPEAFLTIEDKKVSRKHLLITVAPVKAGDGVRTRPNTLLSMR